MKIHRTLALVTIFGVVPSAAAFAGQRRNAARGGMDTDRDGVITRAEWRGTAEGFRQQDTNRDGVLSGTEARPRCRIRPRPTKRPARREAAIRFAAMDADRDGVITRAEWRGNGRRLPPAGHEPRRRALGQRGARGRPGSFTDRRGEAPPRSAAARFAGMDATATA